MQQQKLRSRSASEIVTSDWIYVNKLENTEINLIVESESRGRSDGFAKVNLNQDYGNGNLIKMLVTGSDSSGLSGNIIV